MKRDRNKIEELIQGIRSRSHLEYSRSCEYLENFIDLLDEELNIRRREIEEIENRNRQNGTITKPSDRSIVMKPIITSVIERINSKGEPINFIPGGQRSKCCNFLFAIAGGGFGSEKGFKGIMKNAVQHWFKCENKETLIMTLDWDDNKFRSDWLGIIEAYETKGHQVTVLQYGEFNVMQHYPFS